MHDDTPTIAFTARKNRSVDHDFSQRARQMYLHIAFVELHPERSAIAATPLCQNGGLDTRYWEVVHLNPLTIHRSQICLNCLKRLDRYPRWKVPIGLYADDDTTN